MLREYERLGDAILGLGVLLREKERFGDATFGGGDDLLPETERRARLGDRLLDRRGSRTRGLRERRSSPSENNVIHPKAILGKKKLTSASVAHTSSCTSTATTF